jgi:hypothetical protein
VIIEPSYQTIKAFNNGYAKAKKNDMWGMIDKKGGVFIPFEYDAVSDYNANGVIARKGESHGIIVNGSFNIVGGASKVWDFHGDAKLTYAKVEKKIGFVNNKGEWVIQPQFIKARAFNNGMAPVMNDKKQWGYVNEAGEMAIAFSFRDAEVFGNNGLAPVKEKKLWGFIDKTGKVVIPMSYDITSGGFSMFSKNNIKGFNDGLARVRFNKSWGFLTEKGQPLGGEWYQNAELFSK